MAANPILIVPLHTEPAAPAGTPRLTYRGGPILTAVEVFVMYWGDAWSQGPQAQLMTQIDGFFDYVLTSPLMDQLAEYDMPSASIGHGSRIASVQVAGSPPANVSDADVQRMVQNEISSGSPAPAPGSSTLYFVYLPPAVTVAMGGGASCQNFCGYHNAVGSQLFYAVMPYPDCRGCTGALSVFDALTSTTSHELCEAITDPVPGQGWYDDQNGEIGDICAWKTKTLGAYVVQLEWSNRAGTCR
jgi:hypothetical protein